MRILLSAHKGSPLPDFQGALTTIESLFAQSKFSQGLLQAGHVVEQDWGHESLEERLSFLDQVKALLPPDRNEEVAFTNLRAMVQTGIVGSDAERKTATVVIATGAVLALILALARKGTDDQPGT